LSVTDEVELNAEPQRMAWLAADSVRTELHKNYAPSHRNFTYKCLEISLGMFPDQISGASAFLRCS